MLILGIDPGKKGGIVMRDGLAVVYQRRADGPDGYRQQATNTDPDPGDLRTLLSAVSDYLHLTTYELGQEHCVRQLRDMWRYRRAVTKESDDD